MISQSAIFALLSLTAPLGFTGIAAGLDVRSREIPDWIPLSIGGWALLAMATRWSGISAWDLSLGLALGLAVGMILFASGGFGGGDAKLLTALGMALGWKGFLITLGFTALAGGAFALAAKARGQRDFAYGPAIALGLLGYVSILAWAAWGMAHRGKVMR